MGHKSPVDELVDGIDAIGTILDENLPALKGGLDKLTEKHIDTSQTVTEIKRAVQTTDEIQDEIKRAVSKLDGRMVEFADTLEALNRRMDQLQKTMLELIMETTRTGTGEGGSDSDTEPELADTVKAMEDRLKKLEGNRLLGGDYKKRL